MKKIISILMVIIMIAIIGVITANAEDVYSMSTGSSTVQYTEQSRYCVIIPETIDMNGEYTFNSAEMNLDSDENVTISIQNLNNNGCLEFTHTNGVDTAQKRLGYDYFNVESQKIQELPQNCVAYFRDGDGSSRMGFYLQHDTNDNFKAGDYTGTAEFLVEFHTDT